MARTIKQRQQDAKEVAKGMNAAQKRKTLTPIKSKNSNGGYDASTSTSQRKKDAADVAKAMNAAQKKKTLTPIQKRNTKTSSKGVAGGKRKNELY